MAHGDDEHDSGQDAPVGPRRSNYTPPPGGFRWFGRSTEPEPRGDTVPPVPTSLPSEAEEGMAARLSEQLGELTARLAAEREPSAGAPAPSSPWAEPAVAQQQVYPWDAAASSEQQDDPDRPWATSPSLPPAGPASAAEAPPVAPSTADQVDATEQAEAPEQVDAPLHTDPTEQTDAPEGADAPPAAPETSPAPEQVEASVAPETVGAAELEPERPAVDEPYRELTPTGSFVPPPARASLGDEELLAAVQAPGEGGTLAAIERFQEQLRLREQDTERFTAWEQDVLADGSREAFDEVERVRGGFAGLVPPTTAAIPLPFAGGPNGPAEQAAVEPEPEPEHEVVEAELLEPEPEPEESPAPVELVLDPRLVWRDEPSAPSTVEGEIVADAGDAAEIVPAEPVPASTELEPLAPAPHPAPVGSDLFPVIAPGYEPEPQDHAETVDDREPLPRPVDESGVALDTAPVSSVLAAQEIEELLQPEPARPLPLLSLEASGLEPTPESQRAGRAIRLFWLWFAPQSSVIALGVGALLVLGGLDLPQALLATVTGSLLGLVPLLLGTLAAARTGQPTIVASRAVFGVIGNALPAALSLLSRLLWGAVLLWVIGLGTSTVLVGQGLTGPLGDEQVSILAVAFAFLLALIIAFAGYGLLHGVHLLLSALSALLLAATVALTWPLVDLQTALAAPEGSWTAVLSGTALVLSFTGLAWAFSGGDVARYQRPGGTGGAAVTATGLASLLPTIGLLGYGALLAASDPALGEQLATNPAAALAELLPGWFAVPLVLAMACSLLTGLVIVIYSAAFSVQAVGLAVQRQSAVVFVGLLLAIGAVALILAVPDLRGSIEDLVGTIAVPVAAWAGIFAGDLVLRSRGLDADDLLRSGGRYANVVWGNLAALVLLTVLGFGLRSAELGPLRWQGYLQQPIAELGVPALDAIAANGGVIVALLLGLLWSLCTALPRIRRQQTAVVDA